jgi:retron-type reverse transcriptase
MLFITINNILKDAQDDFRKDKSTETATHAFLENIQKAIKKEKDKPYWNFFFIFSFDLSKAYDVLNHKILLFKLDVYRIRGLVNQWFKSYLCNRKQCVEINYMENIGSHKSLH